MARFSLTFFAPAVTSVTFGALLWAQVPTDRLTLISPAGRDSIETVRSDGREMVALDDLARLFRLDISEDSRAGTISVSAGDAVIILTPNQQLVSVDGRLVSLRAAPRRVRDRWVVPLDFLSRALAPVYDGTLEFRERSRLLLVGDVRVPRILARYRARPGGGELALEVTPSTAHTVEQEDGRLVVLFQADGIDILRAPRPGGDLMTGFSQVEASPGIAVDLGPEFDSFSVSSEPAPNGGAKLTIELRTLGRAATDTSPERPAAPPVDAPRPSPAAPLPDFTAAPTVRVVAIDAGHGGEDPGSQGADGALEKNITLSVARRLRSVIESRLGLRVILTRNRDETVNLDARAAIANNNKADLFISLHVNASPRPSATEAEVFYLSIDEYGPEAREFAAREAQRIPVVGGGTREIDLILWEMAQIRYVDRSARLAHIVEEELHRRVAASPRPVQQAPFRVLVGANMPAVLVELGSISDPDEERRLTSARFQNAVVEAIVASIIRFRDHVERAGQAVASAAEPSGDGHSALQERNE